MPKTTQTIFAGKQDSHHVLLGYHMMSVTFTPVRTLIFDTKPYEGQLLYVLLRKPLILPSA